MQNSYAQTDGTQGATITNAPAYGESGHSGTAYTSEQQNNQSTKDCIKANTGGVGNPVDVCYREFGTGRKADLTKWGDFSSQDEVGTLFQGVLQFFMAIVGGLALLAIMIGGGMIMLGGTDETMLEKGKDILKFTAIGVAIVLFAVTITTLVQTLFYSVEI